jgi:lipopolysaccharide export system permease protein
MEMLPPFGINLFFFSFISLITELLDITNMVVNYHVRLGDVLLLLLYSMPFFMGFITPMSVMMAVLLTFLRMSSDNEIVALRACGMNPNRFLVPVMLFCLMGWLMTTFITMVALPWGNRSYYNLTVDLAKTHIGAVIKERTFIDNFDGVMLYANKINLQDRSLKDVFIEDQRNPSASIIIVAPSGRLITEPEKQAIRLRLFNGSINQVDVKEKSASAISFENYEMILDLRQALPKIKKKRRSIEKMNLWELKQYIGKTDKKEESYLKAIMKVHEKFALPFACFVLGLMAIPLGMQATRGKRSTGIVTGIILFLTYYIVMSMGWSLGQSGTVPPVAGMWAPNILMSAIGVYLYRRMILYRPLPIGRMLAIFKRKGGKKGP